MEIKGHISKKHHPKKKVEKLQTFKMKIKQKFSETMGRSQSIPRSNKKNIKIVDYAKQSKFQNKSNNSSRSSTPDISSFSKRWGSKTSSELHERIELRSLHHNDKSHCFVNQISRDKYTFCDICNEPIVPMGSVLTCKYCQAVSHEKCCHGAGLQCQNNRLSVMDNFIDFEKLSLYYSDNSKITGASDYSEVKLRKKSFNTDASPTESDYHTCKTSFINDYHEENSAAFNFFTEGQKTMQCRDSLVSITSTSSLASQSYEFTTLDRDSIKAYGIEVNPIYGRATVSLDDSFTDVSSIRSSSSSSSFKSESNEHNFYCKPSYIYHEQSSDIIRVEWTNDELTRRMTIFNQNNFGLISEMKSLNGEMCLHGTVRVYINLLRPIQMELTSRPSSIFYVKEMDDVVSKDAKIESLWLPRGTSKRLYSYQYTTTSEVINCLLKKFFIKANPKKFGLYEHTIEGERKVSARKLMDDECPLAMLLVWAEEGIEKLNEIMTVKRLVLQENETGDIEWTGFARPELRNFLSILDREEEDCKSKIRLQYQILGREIVRLLSLLAP